MINCNHVMYLSIACPTIHPGGGRVGLGEDLTFKVKQMPHLHLATM
jgi:hypothetical protein